MERDKQIDLDTLITWVTESNDEYVMSWNYNNKVVTCIEDFPEKCVGFVYEIFHKPSGKRYIGKKILRRKRTRQPLKGYKRKRVDYPESDWLKYTGSADEAKKWKPEDCTRVIHFACARKDEMTFYETMLIFERKALFTDVYLNDNVLGKFYSKTIKEKFGTL